MKLRKLTNGERVYFRIEKFEILDSLNNKRSEWSVKNPILHIRNEELQMAVESFDTIKFPDSESIHKELQKVFMLLEDPVWITKIVIKYMDNLTTKCFNFE